MGRDSKAEGEHSLRNVKISAYGCYVPPKVLTNQDFEKMVDTNDEWIMERTGIRERHIAAPEMATSDMAVEAARAALKQRGMEASELDVIIVCTVTPDYLFPSTACLVQHEIGAKNVWGFDLIAACCSFLFRSERAGRDHRLHGDAGLPVPLDGVPGAARDRREKCVGLRSDRGLLQLPVPI